MFDRKSIATGAAQKPFASLSLSLLSPLPAGEGKGEGESNLKLSHLDVFAPLREASVSIGLPAITLAKAGVHPSFAVALLRRTGPWLNNLHLCFN